MTTAQDMRKSVRRRRRGASPSLPSPPPPPPLPSTSCPRTTSGSSSFCGILLLVTSFALHIQPCWSLHHPLTWEIRAKRSECIYELFKRGDFATFEVFIIDADEKGRPEAAVQIEGPIVSPEIGSVDENGERKWDTMPIPDDGMGRAVNGKTKLGALMQDWIVNWQAFVKKRHHKFQEEGIIHHAFHIDYTYSGENEDATAARADLSRQRQEEMEEQRRRDLEGKKYSGDESPDDEEYQEESGGRIQHILPDYIEPYEWTKPIKTPGWYRMCVTAAENDIAVEMDIRSSADLGGINPDTWHVYTHDEREDIDEEERIMGKNNGEPSAEEVEAKLVAEELEKALKDQVRDYDLESTRKLMNKVSQLVSQMVRKQQDKNHRIKAHEGDAKRNHRRILRSGLVETVLYILITIFQVYTVHKWLLGNNLLGR